MFHRVNTVGKQIGIRESRAVRGARLIPFLVAAMPRWGLAQNNNDPQQS
jgi:hypothetical protein